MRSLSRSWKVPTIWVELQFTSFVYTSYHEFVLIELPSLVGSVGGTGESASFEQLKMLDCSMRKFVTIGLYLGWSFMSILPILLMMVNWKRNWLENMKRMFARHECAVDSAAHEQRNRIQATDN